MTSPRDKKTPPASTPQAPAERERLHSDLREALRTIESLKEDLATREALHAALHEREAYRFARCLVDVKANPWNAWKVPLGFAALLTPKPLRERVRRTVARARVSMLARRDRETRWPSDRPLVSVIVPCFNYGRYVREAVEAVCRQTLQDLELIVVEGGSNDGSTPAVVAGLQHPRMRKIFQERPTPVGENRLAGLRAARGKYVVFLDADDLIEPTYLEKAVLALELTGADVAYPDVQLFDRDDRLWETGDFTLELLAKCNVVPTVAMFRIETWSKRRIGYGTHLELEDYDFWLRFAERGAKGIRIREPLMRYRVHGSSLTDALRERHEAAAERIRREHAPMLRPLRIARVTQSQRHLDYRPGRQANLERLRQPAPPASLRIALANPFLVVGGSDHLMLQVFGDCASADASLLVYSTLMAPGSMGSSARDYARITPDVFELPRELPADVHSEAILHLLRSRQANVLLLVGSRATYELLPRIRAELPALKVVDHLYNAIGHLASNREFSRFIDFHVVASEEVRRALLVRGEDSARIQVIHHGIDMTRCDPRAVVRQDDLPGLRLGPEDRLVLFAGRLSEEKGALRFLDIAARMQSRERIVFAMTGDGPLRAQVEARAAELGVASRVARLGFVPDARPYLRRADAVVIPSDIDGLPLVCLESLALGTPVVASRLGGLPDVIEPGRTGALVEPTDVEGFVRAVDAVLAQGRAEAERECARSVTERFDIRAVRARYFELFRRLAGVGGAGSAGAKEVA